VKIGDVLLNNQKGEFYVLDAFKNIRLKLLTYIVRFCNFKVLTIKNCLPGYDAMWSSRNFHQTTQNDLAEDRIHADLLLYMTSIWRVTYMTYLLFQGCAAIWAA